MNASNTTQPARDSPNGAPMGPGSHPVLDQRNGSSMTSGSVHSSNNVRNNSGPLGTQMSRAEKFEDEKRRIIETCFGKKEDDGSSEVLRLPIESLEADSHSIRILHHAHPHRRRWSISFDSSSSRVCSLQQKTTSHHCRSTQVWASADARSQRKCQQYLFDWENLGA
jgi:hypothetical protein